LSSRPAGSSSRITSGSRFVTVRASLALGYVVATLGIWMLARQLVKAPAPGDPGQLLICWLLVVAGLITHYAVDRSKNAGAGGTKSIPLGHPTYVIDSRAGIILFKLLLMLIGFFGLQFLVPNGPPRRLDFIW
jgi:hypothetical protein